MSHEVAEGMTRGTRIPVLLLACAATLPVHAVELDLENLYFGVGANSITTPYVGDSGLITTVYPQISGFDDSTLTDNYLMSLDGSYGARWFGAGDRLEIGALVTYRNFGFDPGSNPQLAGMADRDGTLEAGPFIGWRFERVQLHLQSYFDLLGEHDGGSARLTLSLPMQGRTAGGKDWYLIPNARIFYFNPELTRYYFGVHAAEAAPGRPAYQPNDSLGAGLGFRFGYRVGGSWAVFGNLGGNWLGGEIEDSPIVDTSFVWNLGLSIGYDF